MRPDPGVLAAFGEHADPVRLPGGEGTAWRAGQIVLKPAGDPRVARWTAELYRDLDRVTAGRDLGFRVPRPLRAAARDGATRDGTARDGTALAVAAVDALMWGGASPVIVGKLGGEPEWGQLLARALVYRLVTEILFRRGDPAGLETVARTADPVTVLVLARLAVKLRIKY